MFVIICQLLVCNLLFGLRLQLLRKWVPPPVDTFHPPHLHKCKCPMFSYRANQTPVRFSIMSETYLFQVSNIYSKTSNIAFYVFFFFNMDNNCLLKISNLSQHPHSWLFVCNALSFGNLALYVSF